MKLTPLFATPLFPFSDPIVHLLGSRRREIKMNLIPFPWLYRHLLANDTGEIGAW